MSDPPLHFIFLAIQKNGGATCHCCIISPFVRAPAGKEERRGDKFRHGNDVAPRHNKRLHPFSLLRSVRVQSSLSLSKKTNIFHYLLLRMIIMTTVVMTIAS